MLRVWLLLGLILAGAAYHGVGLVACMKEGVRAASFVHSQFGRLTNV
jgi:hypothetical protein